MEKRIEGSKNQLAFGRVVAAIGWVGVLWALACLFTAYGYHREEEFGLSLDRTMVGATIFCFSFLVFVFGLSIWLVAAERLERLRKETRS